MEMNVSTASGGLSTHQLADLLFLKAQSIRKRHSQTGSYFGVCPFKLPNGRLRWPSDAVNILMKISRNKRG